MAITEVFGWRESTITDIRYRELDRLILGRHVESHHLGACEVDPVAVMPSASVVGAWSCNTFGDRAGLREE